MCVPQASDRSISEGLLEVGYTVLAFTQTVHKKVDTKTHVNILDIVVRQLKSRPGIVFLKRLSIVLDEDSEKGFGLVRGLETRKSSI